MQTLNRLRSGLLVEALTDELEARMEVDGRSMLRLIRPGDVVHIRSSLGAGLRPGDVAVMQAIPEAGLLVHRVIRRGLEGVTSRGDNCPAADGVFSLDKVIGVVTRVERNGRSVWFGAGRLGRPVAFAVRHGLIWRANRVYYGARRHAGRALKFLGADSRLRPQKGDDGNE